MPLRNYQIAHLAHMMSSPIWGDFSDPGVGKTAPACTFMGWLWNEKRERSIWAMPKTLMKKNQGELMEWSGLSEEDCPIIDGPPKRRSLLMRGDGKVFIMGYQCFCTNWPELVSYHPDITGVYGDEWHLGFKGPNSKRTASLYRFMDRPESQHMGAMTGTIIDGRLDAAYSLIHVAMPTAYGSYEGFLAAHALEDEYGKITGWINLGKVSAILGKIAVRTTFEAAYGPEAKIIQRESVDMTPEQRGAYDEFEETALLELEDSWLDGTLPGVNLIRCRQLMEHPMTFGEPLDRIQQTGKEEALQVHLEHHKLVKKPLVIFAALRESIERIAEQARRTGLRVGTIHGGVSAKRRFEVDEQFRAGTLDVVVASAATAGVGFNWGHVDHIIFMSLDYMDTNFVQAYRRAVRGKRDKPVLIRVMEYRDSVDQKIFSIIERKSALAHEVDPTKERIHIHSKPKEKKPKGSTPLTGKPSMSQFLAK